MEEEGQTTYSNQLPSQIPKSKVWIWVLIGFLIVILAVSAVFLFVPKSGLSSQLNVGIISYNFTSITPVKYTSQSDLTLTVFVKNNGVNATSKGLFVHADPIYSVNHNFTVNPVASISNDFQPGDTLPIKLVMPYESDLKTINVWIGIVNTQNTSDMDVSLKNSTMTAIDVPDLSYLQTSENTPNNSLDPNDINPLTNSASLTGSTSSLDTIYEKYFVCINSCPSGSCIQPNCRVAKDSNGRVAIGWSGTCTTGSFTDCIDPTCFDLCSGNRDSALKSGNFAGKMPSSRVLSTITCSDASGQMGEQCVTIVNKGTSSAAHYVQYIKYNCANSCWQNLI